MEGSVVLFMKVSIFGGVILIAVHFDRRMWLQTGSKKILKAWRLVIIQYFLDKYMFKIHKNSNP